MAAFNGKWQLVSNEGLLPFSKAIGVPDEKLAENKDFGNPDANVVEELNVDGSSVKITVTIGGKVFRESTMGVGSECEATALDGRPAKHLVTVSGNSMSRVQKGAGYECTYNRLVDGSSMTMVMTGPGGVTATRKYRKL